MVDYGGAALVLPAHVSSTSKGQSQEGPQRHRKALDQLHASTPLAESPRNFCFRPPYGGRFGSLGDAFYRYKPPKVPTANPVLSSDWLRRGGSKKRLLRSRCQMS